MCPILQQKRRVMTEFETVCLSATPADLERAADLIRTGGLVAFPTETVYGLGVDPSNGDAVARLYQAKGRPQFNPLIVHCASMSDAESLVEFSDRARDLAQAFWPGALTLVLPLQQGANISPLVTAGLPTLAVRVPDHPVASGLLKTLNGPIAAPSANPSGRVSPTTAAHVLDGLSGRIAAVVDGGACAVGLESTIIGFDPVPTLLRAGGLPAEDVERCLGMSLARAGEAGAPTSPGQLASHYAPNGQVRLNATTPRAGEVMVGFGEIAGQYTLSASGNLVEAAAALFSVLHELNAINAERIAIAPIPEVGLGRAINDRLRRAAAPRD